MLELRNASMYAMYLDGKTLREVGEVFNITMAAVRKAFVRDGYKTRSSAEGSLLKTNPRCKEMYAMYHSGRNFVEVGKEFGVGGATVYTAFRIRGWPTRKHSVNPKVTFNGQTYSLTKVGYYSSTAKNDKTPLLHRVIWTHHNGPIPEGYVIHHIDENKANNDISNLQCMTNSDHGKHHDSLNKWRESLR